MTQEEIILKNWDTYVSQLSKLTDKNSNINVFTQQINELDIITTPASTKTDLVCAYPGGLVEHSLRVLSYVAKLRKVYAVEKEITSSSAILVSLLHDIGKLGEGTKPYYLDKVDEWKKSKLGQMYEINPKIAHVPVPQLSLKFLMDNSFSLDIEEWYAISNVRSDPREQYVQKNEPKLSVILNQAITWACLEGKGKTEASVI